jgi:AraC-like DNA-binding protein
MSRSSVFSPETVLFYRECPPPPGLRHLVLSFWEFAVRAGAGEFPVMHEIFPDGCISLVYRRNDKLNIRGFSVSELHARSIVFPVFDGDIFRGARLSPAACAGLLGCDPAVVEMHQCRAEDGEFGILDNTLLDQLRECGTLEEWIGPFSARLADQGTDRGDVDQKILEAVTIIEESCGEVRIFELAALLGLSVRQFERRFKRSAGLPPKQYARARRFRAAAAALAEGKKVSWADRAAEMGFADQAHLTHEFSSLSGRSPKSFAEKVKKIDHGDLV